MMNLEISPFNGLIVVFILWGLVTYLAVKHVDLVLIRMIEASKQERELRKS